MIFQAFIDYSYGQDVGEDSYFVLAGFIGTYSNWSAFSDAWKAELDRTPVLPHFKMNEAIRTRSGPWKGVQAITRQERINKFVQIIKSHALVRVDSALSRSDYKKHIKGKIPPELDHPYVLCFAQIVSSVAVFQKKNHWGAPIDFVFDEQEKFSAELIKWWPHIKNMMHPLTQAVLGGPPIFRDDKVFLPLQAADLYAWSIRNNLSNNKKILMPKRPELAAFESMHRIQGEFPDLAQMAQSLRPISSSQKKP